MKILMVIIFLYLTQPAAFAAGKYKVERIYDSVFKMPILVKQKSTHKNQTMILLHGLGTNGSKSWDNISDELAKHYHIVAIDLPGFGQSLGKLGVPPSPESYSELVMRIVSAYAKSKVIFVGHSMGAAIGLRFVSQYPFLVDKVVLIAVAGVLQKTVYTKFLMRMASGNRSKDMHSAKASAVDTSNTVAEVAVEVFDNFSFSKKVGRLAKMNKNALIAMNLLETDFSNDIQNIRNKVLLIWGENDPVAPVRTGKMLNFHLKQSKLIVLPKVGHTPHVKEPMEVAAIVHQWLESPKFDKFRFQKPRQINYDCNKKVLKSPITGAFTSLNFNACSNVQLKNVSAKSIQLKDSTASFENVKIVSQKTGLIVEESRVMATNLLIDAPVGIYSKGSKLDLAGAIINYKKSPISASGSLIYWSTSFQSNNGHKIETIHKKQLLR